MVEKCYNVLLVNNIVLFILWQIYDIFINVSYFSFKPTHMSGPRNISKKWNALMLETDYADYIV